MRLSSRWRARGCSFRLLLSMLVIRDERSYRLLSKRSDHFAPVRERERSGEERRGAERRGEERRREEKRGEERRKTLSRHLAAGLQLIGHFLFGRAYTWPIPALYLAYTWPIPGLYLAYTWQGKRDREGFTEECLRMRFHLLCPQRHVALRSFSPRLLCLALKTNNL